MALMSAAERPAVTPDSEGLVEAFLNLSVPEGFHAELIEGEIIVTPPPDGDHGTVFSDLARQFFRMTDPVVDVLPDKGLIVPDGFFIPDGTICATGSFRNTDPWSKPEDVLLVFEVTSSRPDKDRRDKRIGYAKAAIPCYLLVDRGEAKVVLFTGPHRGDYATCTEVRFGDPLPLPEPFLFELDTTPFL